MKTKHWIVFITLGIVWSSSFLWIKIGVQEVSPMVLVAFRMLFGAITATTVALLYKAEWPRDRKTWIIFAILGPASTAIPVFLISWGEQTIDSAIASILNATVPLFTILIAHFWLSDDKMTPQKIIGLIMGFIGVLILLSKDLDPNSTNPVIGQFAVILASLFYAWSAVGARKYTAHVSGYPRAAMPLITATMFMWAFIPVVEKPFVAPALPITWVAVLWLGILGSGLANIMLYYLIHEVGPTRATLVTYIFPLGGVILGIIFLDESLTWQLVVGSVLIISSIAVVNRKPKEAVKSEA